MSQISVPVEQWEGFAKSNSCSNAVEQKGGKPVSVRTFSYNGFIYTSFGTMYGSYSNSKLKPTIQAYKLLPESLYPGVTTPIYHDEDAIASGLRERGDLTGLIVSVAGKMAVCAEKVDFLCGLPGTRPIAIEEAKDFNAEQEGSGWRSQWYEGVCSWFTLNGHPVAIYESEDHDSHAVLFWKGMGLIQEMSIADDIELSPIEMSGVGAMVVQAGIPGQHGQLELFV